MDGDLTAMLRAASHGDRESLDRLVPLVYRELAEIAHRQLGSGGDRAMQTVSLVHEAYLKLIDQRAVAWQDRAHFFAVATTLMRRILVDRIRAERAEKRGGQAVTVMFDDDAVAEDRMPLLDVLRLHDALEALAALDATQARVVELRVFGGLTVEETALVLAVSPRTVKREWSMGRAFLLRALDEVA